MPAKLTDRQKKFCDEYLIDLNATQAAIRAGYSEKTAYSISNELLKKPEIVARIKKRRDAQIKRTEITADRVLLELARIAFVDGSALVQRPVRRHLERRKRRVRGAP